MYTPLILPDLRMMIEEKDDLGLAEFCDVLHPAVTAEILDGLESEDLWTVLSNCPLQRRVEIFEFLSLSRQVQLVDGLERKKLSELIEAMSADDRVDLLSRLDSERVESLLPLIAQAERSDIRKLLSFSEDSAGSIMTTEYASLPAEITVSEALDRLRKQAPDRETIYYVYILDSGRRLQGFISLRELILAKPTTSLSEIMRRDVISVRVDDDQEIVAQELARYDFLAIPVVDNQNRLVGIVTHDDVMDVFREEATEDTHLLAAVSPLEDSYLETGLMTIAWKRGVWLFFLSTMAIMNAVLLQQYSSISMKHIWLVAFLPLVLGSGGNAGAQTATLTIRSMALGEMASVKILHFLKREVLVGFLLGVTLAAFGFLATLFWPEMGAKNSLIVGVTILLVVQMGTINGAVLPLVFRRLGMDPALMSNPLIAGLQDILGVITYYGVAILLLETL